MRDRALEKLKGGVKYLHAFVMAVALDGNSMGTVRNAAEPCHVQLREEVVRLPDCGPDISYCHLELNCEEGGATPLLVRQGACHPTAASRALE